MNLKKIFLICSLGLVLFAGCKGGAQNNDATEKPSKPKKEYPNDLNPTYGALASESQDFIFDTESVGFTTITIRRSEWNKMLTYYDYFYKNENSVIAESYEYQKGSYTWKFNTVGFRLRGNTSRFRPQGKDTASDETGHTQMNADWSQDYYNYAASCSDDDYRQSHFKVDFEPFDDDDRKMSNCMKGVALKRSDSLFSKEIFCYKLFHLYGIWTAPRASQTKVYINIIEDVDNEGEVEENISNCETTKLDYGVYEMFEEVNKQSLKGRQAKSGNNTAKNAWKTNEGDLWKCAGGDLTSDDPAKFNCEEIIIKNADKDKSQWSAVWFSPTYDLKTNKDKLRSASQYIRGFISELNSLSNTDEFSTEGIAARKAFYEKWFDVDFFIKTYAVNILVGMDDDYWGNANNYYLYFDNSKNGSGKCYFIPFDYDNTLGGSIDGDKVYRDPLSWGIKENGTKCIRPLLDRLLEVPEYKEKFIETLIEVSSQDPSSPWNRDNCINMWQKWHNQVRDLVDTKDITGRIGATSINDGNSKHRLTTITNNIYEQVTENFQTWLTKEPVDLYFDLNGGNIQGNTASKKITYKGAAFNINEKINNPTRAGYMFAGWTKTKDGTDYVLSYNGESEFTVYASWIDISSYGSELTIFEIKDTSFKGIKIGIINLPNENFRRSFRINGKEVGNDAADSDNKKYLNYANIWAYPYTEPGKTYEISVQYQSKGYATLGESNTISIIAESGVGEFKVLNNPEWYIENNTLQWKTEPVIQIGDDIAPATNNNWDEYYLLELQTSVQKELISADDPRNSHYGLPDAEDELKVYDNWWNYQTWNYLGASTGSGFNFKDSLVKENKKDALDGLQDNFVFKLCYKYNNSTYGDMLLIICDYDTSKAFSLDLQ